MERILHDLKILIISPAYYPSQGGVQVEIRLLVNELVKMGHQITILTKEIPGIPNVEKSPGLHIYRLPDSRIRLDPWNGMLFFWKNRSRIKKIVSDENIDLIHVHQFDISCHYVFFLKKIVALPIMSTVHTSMLNDTEYLRVRFRITEPFRWVLRILPTRWFEIRSIRTADYCITVSRGLEQLCKSVRSDDCVCTIPNAISLQQFNPGIEPIGFSCKEPVILCPGRISPEKGQNYLVDALKIVREKIPAHVVLIGEEHANMLPIIIKQVQDLGLEGFVHIVPAKPYETIPAYYKGADLIVIPSLSESFGLAALENMALGNVVVASNVGGIPDLIEHGKTGLLVPPGDPQKLADAIITALTDINLRHEIRKNAVEKAQEYDIVSVAEETELCYRRNR